MINQVVPNNTFKRVFSDFTQPQNGWYLAENYHQNEKEKSRKYGKTIVAGALVTGFGILALTKGAIPKSASKYLEKLRLRLEEKTLKNGKLQKFYKYALGKVEGFIEKSRSINNITSLKDVLFQKFMFGKDGNRTFTRKIHQGITNLFTKIARKTVNSSYSSTNEKFALLSEYVLNLNEKLLRANPNNPEIKSAIELINSKLSNVNKYFEEGFGLNARNKRLNSMNEATKDLFDYLWQASFSDVKNFNSSNMYQTFIAEAKLMPHKMKMREEVNILKSKIFNDTPNGQKGAIQEILTEYEKILPQDEFNKLKNRINKTIKSLDKSINKETSQFYDKNRDLKLGSAPTDVLSILATVGTVGWFLGKSKDKDERISAGLKYGIPAIGAIATSLYCTARLISGGKAMAFGLLSGWIMNKMGVIADDTRKKFDVGISIKNRQTNKS